MKKAIGVIMVTAALVVALLPSTRAEIHWQFTSPRNTTSGFESYVKAWPRGRHSAEARARYDELGWADALDANTTQGFEQYMERHGGAEHVADARQRLEALRWEEALAGNTVQGYERYIELHGDGAHLAEARDNIESLFWQETKAGNTCRVLQTYVDRYPAGRYVQEARSRQAALRVNDAVFIKAQQSGTVEDLKAFLVEFPGHRRETEAKRALRIASKAIVVVDYPREVRATGRYSWNTVFRETGGHTGYKLRSTDFYIRDPSGARWSNSWGEGVDVRPGATAMVDYWCDKSSKWSGGTYHAVWVGKDDLGNPIRIVQEIRLAK